MPIHEDHGRIKLVTRALCAVGLAAAAGCTDSAGVDTDTETSAAFADGEDVELRGYPIPTYYDANLPPPDPAQSGAGPKPYYTEVAAASESLAAQAGRDVLSTLGRDAVDAAVTMMPMLGVVEPQSSGLGAGALMLIYRVNAPEAEKTVVIDCREVAPKAATPNMLSTQSSTDLKSTSGITVGVPGLLHCMKAALALDHVGNTTVAGALGPAIKTAQGFKISSRLAEATSSDRLRNQPGNSYYDEARKVFRPNGSSLSTGSLLKQTNLANAMQAIVDNAGPEGNNLDSFYKCGHVAGIADAIIDTQKNGKRYTSGFGRMTCTDLANFSARRTDPIQRSYRGYTVVTTPAPSSGIHLLGLLGVLERFNIGASGYGFGEKNTMNVMQEAMRLVFADRTKWLGDPDFVAFPEDGLLSNGYLAARSSLITAGQRLKTVSAGDPWLYETGVAQAADEPPTKPNGKPQREGADTTHFVVADAEGNIVSVTQTVSDLWGTGLMVKGKGIMLNDQLLNFNDTPTKSSTDPGANDIAGGKRPRTTLAPTLVFAKSTPIAAFGSPGGTTIINSALNFFLNLADHKMKLQRAVAEERFSLDSPSSSAETEIESGFLATVLSSLGKLGYHFDSVSAIGAVQAVIINPSDRRKYATADPRRLGAVSGVVGN